MSTLRRRGFTMVEVMIAIAILAILAVLIYMLVFASTAHTQTHATTVHLENQCRVIMEEIVRDLRNTPASRCTLGGTNLTAVAGFWVSDTVTLTPVEQDTPLSASGARDDTTSKTFNPFTTSAAALRTIVWSTTPLEGPVPGTGADGQNNVTGAGSNDGLVDESDIRRVETIIGPPAVTTTRWLTKSSTSRFPTTALAATSGGSGDPLFPAPAPSGDGTRFTASPPALQFAIRSTTATLVVAPPASADFSVQITVTLQGLDSRGRLLTRSLTSSVNLRN